MAEVEPGGTEEQAEVGEEPVEVAETRISLTNVVGSVFRAHRFGIYAQFEQDGHTEIGVLFPGKSFINSSLLLGDSVKTDQELCLLFPPGMSVCMDLVSQVSRLVPESGGSLGLGAKAEPGDKKVEQEKGEEKKCGWVIMLLWFGGLEAKPDKSRFSDGTLFSSEDSSFSKRMDWISDRVMLPEQTNKSTDSKGDNWFVTTITMPRPNTAVAHPDLATVIGASGTVSLLQRPHGGIIACGTDRVFFHRSRVYMDGIHLSVTVNLSQALSLGKKVTVDYGLNDQPDGPVFEDCPCTYVALLVYIGTRPTISQLRHQPFPLAEDENNKYLVAKIVKFDPPGPSGVESGIAEILRPTEMNTLAFTKNSFKRYVDVESSLKFVQFHRERMFHLGALQAKADLQYFFSSCAFGMNIFYCYASPIPGGGGGQQFKGCDLTHEVSLGWKGSVSFLHTTGQGGLTLTPNTKEDTLLYPRVFSFQSTKFLGREGLDIKTYEDIVEGVTPPRCEYMNGFSTCPEVKDTFCARVHDIFPPQGNSGVSSGVVYIESGQKIDQKAVFDRKDCTIFGWSLEKTDLQYVLELNEPCFVKLEPLPECELDCEVQTRVVSLWIGWPKEYASYNHPSEVPPVDRHKLLLYLEAHNLSIRDFLSVIKGEKLPRIFIPFRKDEMKGTVVQLDRGSKSRGIGLKEQRQGRDAGAVSGVIKVDKGPLIGALVTFHRRNTWVLGYNMGKADLTNLFIEGQKVSLEAVNITVDDRKKYPGLPYQYKHRATLVWTSKFRPRNDIDKTVPESVHVNNWLKKRGLSWEKFQQLARGKLPIVPQEIACRHRTNMLRGGELESLISPLEHQTMQGAGAGPSMGHPRIEALPVFRHGSEAARICDEALSVMGPTDSRISRIIQSDQNAQMAFHIHKALGYALDEYKNFTGRGTSGHYSGFGDVFRSGPSEQHGGPPGAWGGVMGGGGGQVNMGGQQRGMGGQQGGMGVPTGGMGSGLQQGGPGFIGGGSYQQANQMANRLQQMAMEENGGRGGGRRSLEFQGGGHGQGQGQVHGQVHCTQTFSSVSWGPEATTPAFVRFSASVGL